MDGLKKFFSLLTLLLGLTLTNAFAGSDIISLYQGSKLIFDDEIGFASHYYLSAPKSMKKIDGTMRRQFASVKKGISPLEIVKNYEQAIRQKGGTIIHVSDNAYRYAHPETGEWVWFMRDFFTSGRRTRYNHYGYMQLPREAENYVVGKVSTDASDIFISVAAAVVEEVTYYTVVTVVTEPMDMGNVTMQVLNEGIAANGKVAIYDLYFDSGKAVLKKKSGGALKIMAGYLKKHPQKKFFIVGHTDNVGGLKYNLELSKKRAEAVLAELVKSYGVTGDRLTAYGVGPVVPVTTNSTKAGKARNRRVELVER